MTAVLGISAHYHDSAAALIVDGQIACAIAQERISRIKNDSSLPIQAATACLGFAGLTSDDIDAVVFYEEPFLKLERVMVQLLRNFPRSIAQFPRAISSQMGTRIWVRDLLSEHLGIDRRRIHCTQHHKSHAGSAFFPSAFESAAILVVDGVGEHQTTSIWKGSGNQITLLDSLEFPHSLGLFYAGLTGYLGFEINEGEYKVMGLAALGKDRFKEEFSKLIRIHKDGSFELDISYFGYLSDSELGFGKKLEKLLGPRRMPGKSWNLSQPEDQRYADIACSLQNTLEEAMLSLARRALERTGEKQLCLAGGVALNAVANARIAKELGVPLFVQPAAGDAGGALGAALLHACEIGSKRYALTTAALGLPLSLDNVNELARGLGLTTTRLADPLRDMAARIAKDEIVAYATGRFEWGPRALGQRSILANPAKHATKDRLNRIIKKREDFRPFSPAVKEEKMSQWFEGSPNEMTPYMTTVVQVLPEKRSGLAAITHGDGSARVQSVKSDQSLYGLLTHLEDTGLPPIALNTSLNGPGEPIAASIQDVLAFYVQYPVDALVVEDLLITGKR